jgi:hypothetical protein
VQTPKQGNRHRAKTKGAVALSFPGRKSPPQENIAMISIDAGKN